MVRYRLGILVCLLAGCVGQPTVADPPPTDHLFARSRDPGFVLRIGIEHLPPDVGAAVAPAPIVEAQPRMAPPAPARTTPYRAGRREPDAAYRHTWSLSTGDLAAIDDPIARETLHFVQDLIDADLDRSRRDVTAPLLGMHDHDPRGGMLLQSEQDLLDAEEEWLQERGPSLMRRPLPRMLRPLPLVQRLELEFDHFRSDHVPMTVPYQDRHRAERSLGRVSVRIDVDDLRDPIEISYVYRGVRIGSSQDRGRLSIDLDLSDTVRLELRTRTEYRIGERHARADLAYRPSATTSWHVAIGDDMDFLSTSSIYSSFETPMDGEPGLVLYAVHLF